jgi:copper oxidase (laccase) domain-containing protein
MAVWGYQETVHTKEAANIYQQRTGQQPADGLILDAAAALAGVLTARCERYV